MSKISSYTDVNGRKDNQDRFLIVPKILKGSKIILSCVFDGMGGTDQGDVASSIAKSNVEVWIERVYPSLEDLAHVKESLTKLVNKINDEINAYKEKAEISTGSTICLLIIRDGEYIALNIGDSRIYKFGSKNIQITKDQTLAQREIDNGNLTEEEAKTHPGSHKLLQCLGMDSNPNPDFFKGKYKDGDYFLLCSDGMYNTLDIREMSEIILDKSLGTKDKLIFLSNQAKDKKEKDNITGVLIEIC